jgi:hypothetical protein
LNVDQQLQAEVDPFRIERGSVDNCLARIAPRKAVAPTDHRNEALRVRLWRPSSLGVPSKLRREAEPEPSGQPEGGVWFALQQRGSRRRRRSPMADTVRGVEYYYVTVPDAPGEGQRILSALKDRSVNLLAYLGFPLGGGQSQIDLVPEDAESLKGAAERAGITLSEAKRAFLIQGDDRVGAVADTTAKLAEANINVTAAAATGAGSGRYGMILWVAEADYVRAADALGA